MNERHEVKFPQYHEMVLKYAKRIIDEKDYTGLTQILKNYDRAVKNQHKILDNPDYPFWEMISSELANGGT